MRSIIIAGFLAALTMGNHNGKEEKLKFSFYSLSTEIEQKGSVKNVTINTCDGGVIANVT
jgi:hypothetical protein